MASLTAGTEFGQWADEPLMGGVKIDAHVYSRLIRCGISSVCQVLSEKNMIKKSIRSLAEVIWADVG